MMRIGLPSFGADGGKSGIGSYLYELIKRFDSQEEFRFELIGPKSDADHFLSGTKNIDFFPVEGADGSPIQNYFWNQNRLPGICSQRGYDLLFLPAANRRLTGKAPCPTVGTVHDLASVHIRQKYDFKHAVFNRRMLPHLIGKLDHIITVSGFSKNDIVNTAKVRPEKVTVIHLAADDKRFFPSDSKKAAEHIAGTYSVGIPYLLYISRLEHPGKNHVNLIKAFELYRDSSPDAMSLVLPGPAKERSEEIFEYARNSRYADDIYFPGFIASEDVADFYRGASLFVLPSLFEGFGLPVLEAMACGTAVISSNAASLPEVAGEHTPLFDPHDPQEMAQAIRTALDSDEARQQLVSKGLKWSSRFSWDLTTERTLEIFRQTYKESQGR